MPTEPPAPGAQPWLEDAHLLERQKAPDWLKALRATGAEQFAQTGLPTPAWEGWQHTHLRPLASARFHYTTEAAKFDAKKLPPKLLEESHRIVLVNGQYQPQLSSAPAGVEVMGLMEAVEKKLEGLEDHLVSVGDLRETPFKALNTAYLHDGLVLKVGAGVEAAAPLEVLFYNLGEEGSFAPAIYPRLLYWLGKSSKLTLLERHMGEGTYFANSHATAVLEPESRLGFYRFEEESPAAFHFSFLSLTQQKDSSFEGFSCASGGALSREEFRIQLIESGILSNIGGVYLLKDHQNHDFTILMDHFEPNGKSVQHVRGVVDGQARAVFQGKIHVRRSAQKTDGNQSSHALLLSDQAEASFKPELEIYADDVKCGHGATSGQLDREALFYLQSRGIPQAEARALLIQSFLGAALEQVSFAPAKEIYAEKIRSWLSQ